MVVGSLLKARRPWKDFFSQRWLCFPVGFTNERTQNGDVLRSNSRAHLAPPSGSINQNWRHRCFYSHRLSRRMDTTPAEAQVNNKTVGSCSPGQCVDKDTTKECCERGQYGGLFGYLHLISKISTAFEPASINSRYTWGKTSSKISVFGGLSSSAKYNSSCFINSLPQQSRIFGSGFWSWRRRDPPRSPCTRCRSFFSSGNNRTLSVHTSQLSEDSVSRLDVADASEVDTEMLLDSDEDFDFQNFPALTSSHYQDYERPVQLQVKKRVPWQIKSKLFNKDTELTEESIPKCRGRAYDFGLGGTLSIPPPPLEEGARPQGGFDTNICMDQYEAAPPEVPSSSSLFFGEGWPKPSR